MRRAKLFTWGFATGRFTCCLLGTCHVFPCRTVPAGGARPRGKLARHRLSVLAGLARHQGVAGLARHPCVAGLARHQGVAGLARHPCVAGLARHQCVAGLARHQCVAGLARHQCVAGLARRHVQPVCAAPITPSGSGGTLEREEKGGKF
jgi:hypothetical protein